MPKKKYRVKRINSEFEDVPMTPMIDVVFQLLVYFVVTFEPMDIFTNLQVYRPSPDAAAKKDDKPPEVIKISIFQGGGFTINDKAVTEDQLRQLLFSLADLNPKQTIMLMCTAFSEHEHLITALDLCAEAGLKNLSVISTN